VKVGDLVQDIHSIVMGIVVKCDQIPHWEHRHELNAAKHEYWLVRWMQPPGNDILTTEESWRQTHDLKIVSKHS